jgi:peptidoglycan-associated lipoprotein
MEQSSLMKRNRFVLVLFAVLATSGFAGCSKKNADLELEAARKAIADAQSRRASDCAKETYQAAEAAIAEANRLAESGEIDAAKAKAVEAQTLAEQAAAASKPGCADKQEDEDEDKQAKSDTDAAAAMTLPTGDILETVYFDYNDASIREDSKAVLTKISDVMRKQAALVIEVEGHCDVRGSTEYNLHLGERRARSVEKYLTTQGVSPKQIQIISYGEERPLDLGDSEGAHQKNRRAEIHKTK